MLHQPIALLSRIPGWMYRFLEHVSSLFEQFWTYYCMSNWNAWESKHEALNMKLQAGDSPRSQLLWPSRSQQLGPNAKRRGAAWSSSPTTSPGSRNNPWKCQEWMRLLSCIPILSLAQVLPASGPWFSDLCRLDTWSSITNAPIAMTSVTPICQFDGYPFRIVRNQEIMIVGENSLQSTSLTIVSWIVDISAGFAFATPCDFSQCINGHGKHQLPTWLIGFLSFLAKLLTVITSQYQQ